MSLSLTCSLDRTGFPIIALPGLPFRISWLPVTKIQFEHFLVDQGTLDNDWYQDKLTNYNPRVSPSQLSNTNYWQAFLTGMLPDEALLYARWLGDGADLPTAAEWKSALTALRFPADSAYVDTVLNLPRLNPRAHQLMQNLDRVLQGEYVQLGGKSFLFDQMVMRLGVLELLFDDYQRLSYCCWGQVSRRFANSGNNPLNDLTPLRFTQRTGVRMNTLGFRLIFR
jgi:hypothetical protein